ncbi:MAG: hypothetical protein ACLFNL_07270 [Bacteroidales bacterium]
MNKYSIILLLLMFSFSQATGQVEPEEKSSVSLGGYVKYMNTNMDPPGYLYNYLDLPEGAWFNESMIHNRLNFRLFATNNLKVAFEVRNRLIYGDFVESFPGYHRMIERDDGYLNDLTFNIVEDDAYLLNTSIDRLWLNYILGDFEITLGRQRINWGQSYVWNPNDIFNTYSFFDFDYEERPGSDAIRLQYYPTYSSSIETAAKINKDGKITAAGYYRLNVSNFDIQFLSGILNQEDFVAGIGWSGNLKQFGVNGELTYLHPTNESEGTDPVVLSSLSANYMFDNSLYLQFEGFYNGYYQYMDTDAFADFYFTPVSLKTMSYSEFSWFGQGSYPIHPLLTGTLAFMYYPDISGYFINPSLRYSLSDNIEISTYVQIFKDNSSKEFNEQINFLFFRLKWSF